jgi:hypothetical protein
VVEVAEEVVVEELFGITELVVGSSGWGNDWSRLPLAMHSWRKTAAGKSHGLASLAGAAGRFLAQEGRRDEVLLLARSDSSGWLIGDGQRQANGGGAEKSSESSSRTGLGKSKMGDGSLGCHP